MQISDIRKLVKKYSRKYDTNNPFDLAEYLNIRVFYVPLGELSGFYKYMKRHKCIFINSDIEDERTLRFIMAHELGHALLHTRENCYFLEKNTYLKTNKFETEANLFAINLLVTDDVLNEHRDYTVEQLSRLTGYNERLLELRVNKS